jgi:hypothetical protein
MYGSFRSLARTSSAVTHAPQLVWRRTIMHDLLAASISTASELVPSTNQANFASTAVHVKLVSGGLHARRKSAEHRSACRCFHDGFPNVFVRNAVSIRNRHVAFLCSFHRPDVIFEQLSVMYALPRLFIGSFTVVLPFFPTGTLERVRSLQTDVRMCCDIRAQSTPATGHQWERRAPYCHAPALHAIGAERSMMSSYAHWHQTHCFSIANGKVECR